MRVQENRKPPLDVVCLGKKRCKMMRGRKIIEMGSSSSVGYMRNIADILQKWKDLRNADIMPNRGIYAIMQAYQSYTTTAFKGGEI